MADVLHRRDFRLLLAGQFVSDFGGQLVLFALPTLAIFVLGATPFQVSSLTGAEYAVVPLFAILAGTLVDRWRRRRTMVTANIVRASAIGILAALCLTHALCLPILFAGALVAAIASLFFDTAYQPYLAGLVGRTAYQRANAAMTAGAVLARALATTLGGPLVMLFGAPLSLCANVATYAFGTGALGAIAHAEPPHSLPHGRLRDDLRAAARIFARDAILRRLATVTSIYYFSGAIVDAVLPLYAYRTIHLSPLQFGIVLGVANVGMVAGAFIPKLLQQVGTFKTISLLLGLIALGHAVCFISMMPLAAMVLGRLLVAAAAPAYDVLVQSIATERVDDRMLGRMNAGLRTATNSVLPFGCLAGGTLVTHGGYAFVIACSAVGFLVAIGVNVVLARNAGTTLVRCLPFPTENSPLQSAA